MPARLDHTIVHARNPKASAAFLATILGLPPPETVGRFDPDGHRLEVLTRSG